MSEAALAEALKAVAAAHSAGRTKEARALCDRLLAAHPDEGDAHMWSGMIAMAELRWASAIDAFERALAQRLEPWSLGNLGACRLKVGRLEEAERSLREAVRLKPDLLAPWLGLATALHGLRRFDEALDVLDRAEAANAGDHQIDTRRGCTLAALGRYEAAQAVFERAAAHAPGFIYPRLVRFDRGTFDAIGDVPQPDEAPVLAHRGASGAAVDRVVLVSCNPPYARKYGIPFLRSYAEHRRAGELLHVHVPDPDATVVRELVEAADGAGLSALALTTEESPYPAGAEARRRAYYACARLMHLPRWLDQYRVPVLVLDVDYIVERPLDGLFEAADESDLALNARRPIDSPWLDVIANVILARPTPAAHRYLRAVAGYVRGVLDREHKAWLVDQAALFCTLKLFERFSRAPAIAWLPQAHESGLFHIGHVYDHLLEDPRYRRYANG